MNVHCLIYIYISLTQDLEELAVLAGFTGTAILGEMHAFRARDPRVDDIGEGMSPLQVRQIDSFSFIRYRTYGP
jgi:hypothetical protein